MTCGEECMSIRRNWSRGLRKNTMSQNWFIMKSCAKDFQSRAKLSAKDAIHVACAYHGRCESFLTCDDELIRRAKRLNLEIKIMNPVEYIREVEK